MATECTTSLIPFPTRRMSGRRCHFIRICQLSLKSEHVLRVAYELDQLLNDAVFEKATLQYGRSPSSNWELQEGKCQSTTVTQNKCTFFANILSLASKSELYDPSQLSGTSLSNFGIGMSTSFISSSDITPFPCSTPSSSSYPRPISASVSDTSNATLSSDSAFVLSISDPNLLSDFCRPGD